MEELSERDRDELASHLAECDPCRRARDEHREVWSALGAASMAAGSTDAEFLAAVRKRCSPLPSLPRRWRSSLGSPAGRWIAAAAAVILAATGFLWFVSGSEDQAIIDNLTVLEDLQSVQAGSEMEVAEVGRELLSLFDEEPEAADADEWLDLLEASVPKQKG